MYELANYWILQTLAMMLTVFLLPRLYLTNVLGAIFTVAALSFINTSIWSATLFFSIPIDFSTHAIVLFLANGLLFWALVKLLPGIEVKGFLAALAAPVVFTFCSYFGYQYGRDIDWIALGGDAIAAVSTLKDNLLDEADRASTASAEEGEEPALSSSEREVSEEEERLPEER